MDYSSSNKPEGGSSSSGSDEFKYQYKDQGEPSNAPPPPSSAPPPPPPQPRSFNWLAFCGITCGVLAILGVIAGVVLFNLGKGAMDTFQPMIDASMQVEQTDLATIKAQARSVNSAQVAANPTAFTEGWLELEGVIIPDPGSGSENPGGQEGTAYLLVGNIVVIDSSNTSRVGLAGDTLRAWGKAVTFDATAIPLVGGLIDKAMKEDPSATDFSSLVLFMAKGVELAGSTKPQNSDPTIDPVDNPGGESTEREQDDGWL